MGCSAGSKSSCRGTLPNSSEPVVIISVYSRQRRLTRRRKYRQCRSVQSIMGATHNRYDKSFIRLSFRTLSRSNKPLDPLSILTTRGHDRVRFTAPGHLQTGTTTASERCQCTRSAHEIRRHVWRQCAVPRRRRDHVVHEKVAARLTRASRRLSSIDVADTKPLNKAPLKRFALRCCRKKHLNHNSYRY